MLNEKKLIDWCWCYLSFSNDPESWEHTYIVDILNGYNGSCYDNDGHVHTYQEIRNKFMEYDE